MTGKWLTLQYRRNVGIVLYARIAGEQKQKRRRPRCIFGEHTMRQGTVFQVSISNSCAKSVICTSHMHQFSRSVDEVLPAVNGGDQNDTRAVKYIKSE